MKHVVLISGFALALAALGCSKSDRATIKIDGSSTVFPISQAVAEEFGLIDNFCWASDYPHPEGSWPHSPEAAMPWSLVGRKSRLVARSGSPS